MIRTPTPKNYFLPEFPWSEISQFALAESWRKEVARPPLHLHPWWAVRLGTVFRGILIASLGGDPSGEGFFSPDPGIKGKVVLDPFVGSGTTLLEAVKLGARAIGVDINPVAAFASKQALSFVEEEELLEAFSLLEESVGWDIGQYYTTLDPETGERIPVLYSFWVKVVHSPEGEEIPLFKSFIFAKHVYPDKKPLAHAICPACWHIVPTRHDADRAVCPKCGFRFDPQAGFVKKRGRAVEGLAGREYNLLDLLPQGRPPDHRMYALLALRKNGQKIYLPVGEHDIRLYEAASERLARESHLLPLPQGEVLPGFNTDQARRYGYLHWRDFFNERQLLTLGLLLRGILGLQNPAVRDAFIGLFSATLDYNNMFCTYKGEGTGAVRPLFSHHILKPEYTPLENSVWGVAESSGTFSSLFHRKLLPAKRYLASPYERSPSGQKIFVTKKPLNPVFAEEAKEVLDGTAEVAVLCGDSSHLPLPDSCVDAVVTDPPYGDFVNYSELSDFFYAWLSVAFSSEDPAFAKRSTRDEGEVQDSDLRSFGQKLSRVFAEVNRVLKDDGVLAFTFHHSRFEAWAQLARALKEAGFVVKAAYPVYGELSRSKVKAQSKAPIHIDIVLFCVKAKSVAPRSTGQKGDVKDPSQVLLEMRRFAEERGIDFSEGDFLNLRYAFALMASLRDEVATEIGTLLWRQLVSAFDKLSSGEIEAAKGEIEKAVITAQILEDASKIAPIIRVNLPGIENKWVLETLDQTLDALSRGEIGIAVASLTLLLLH